MRNAKAFVMAFCAMLLLGTFATAQYRDRDWNRRGGGSGVQLYRSAHADVDEARKMLLVAGRGDPDLRQIADAVSSVGSELGGAEQELDQGRGVNPPVEPVRGRDAYDRALNLLERAHGKISAANGRTRNPDALAHGDNAQKRLEQVLQKLEGGRARSGSRRGGGGSAVQLYRSAHANVDEARKMLLMAGGGAPDLRQLADLISAVGSELGGAEQELDQGRGVNPPPDPVRGRDPYDRAVNLLENAHRKIAAANGRNPNPDSLAHGDTAQRRLEEALRQLQRR